MLTHEQIRECDDELLDIQKGRLANPPYSNDTKKRLVELALSVGAESLLDHDLDNDRSAFPELIKRIHQALQTASMIDACRTAAKNYEIAVRAQRISVGAMLAAVCAAIASWWPH